MAHLTSKKKLKSLQLPCCNNNKIKKKKKKATKKAKLQTNLEVSEDEKEEEEREESGDADVASDENFLLPTERAAPMFGLTLDLEFNDEKAMQILAKQRKNNCYFFAELVLSVVSLRLLFTTHTHTHTLRSAFCILFIISLAS